MHPALAAVVRRGRGAAVAAFLLLSAVQTTVFVLLPLALLHPAAPRAVLATMRGVAMACVACGASLVERLGVSVSVDVRGATEKQLTSDVKNLIVVMNHHSYVDWLYAWSIVLRFGWGSSLVCTVKELHRHLPGLGWAMQLLRYIFLRRRWADDEERIACGVRSLQRDGPSAVLLFPEGTALSKSNVARSHQFAKDHDLPTYDNVLTPRTRGFVHLFNLMKASAEPLVVWDVTAGYVGLPGGSTEADFVRGVWPTRVHYRISRWPGEQLPADERALAQWLRERWGEKEQLIDDYNDCDGSHMMLPAESSLPSSPGLDGPSDKAMLLPSVSTSAFPWDAWTHSGAPAFAVANLVVFPLLLALFSWARWWLLVGCAVCAVAGKLGGFDTLITGAPRRTKGR